MPGRQQASILLALGLGGCALATAVPPSVDVLGVQLTGLGLTEQQLSLTLCVTNPNGQALDFRRVTADLDVSGLSLANGVSELAVRLPARSSTVVPFTVVTTVRNLGAQLLGIARTGIVDYRVHGTVALDGLAGIPLPYSRSGRLDALAGGLDLVSSASDAPGPSACMPAAAPST